MTENTPGKGMKYIERKSNWKGRRTSYLKIRISASCLEPGESQRNSTVPSLRPQHSTQYPPWRDRPISQGSREPHKGHKFPMWKMFPMDRLERNSFFTYLQQNSLYELLELSISVLASFPQNFHSSFRGSLHHHHHSKALPWAFPSAGHRPLRAGHSSSRQLLTLLCLDLPQYPGQRQQSMGRLLQIPH